MVIKTTLIQRPNGFVRLDILIAIFFLVGIATFYFYSEKTDPAVILTSKQVMTLFDQFSKEVTPVFNRRCSGCHGIIKEEFADLKKAFNSQGLLRWGVDEGGLLSSQDLCQSAYEVCTKGYGEDKKIIFPIDYRNDAVVSPLLRSTLAKTYSGAVHPEIFSSPDDPDFQTLHRWVSKEIEARPHPAPVPENEAERFFAEKVSPILVRKTCFGCHGPLAFNDLKLDPGIPIYPDRFTVDLHHKNRMAMLGNVTRMVHLWGDVEQSKQLLKNIPIEQGGIFHKGGNQFFEKGDPDYQVMLRWLQMEAENARKNTGADLGDPTGIIFVRRPANTPERYFEDDSFLPGGDLIWLKEGQELNLTASLHTDKVDIRSPDVSYDAKSVLFVMRTHLDRPFNIWELELSSGKARQLTFSRDPAINYMDPIYIPDPDDETGNQLDQVCLCFVSNKEGQWCQSSPGDILGEAERGTVTSIFDKQRNEKDETFSGAIIRIVRGTNNGEERIIQSQQSGTLVFDRPMPLPCDSTTHYIIKTPSRMAAKYDAYRMRLAMPGKERKIFNSSMKRMTYSASQIRRPHMRSDGEIMFTALRTGWQDGRPFYNGAIFRTHIDGSNFHTHNGNRSGIPIHGDNHEMPNGLEVRIGQNADSWWGGMLLLSDHQFGPTIEIENPLDNLDHPYRHGRKPDHAMFSFVPGWISLDKDAECRGISPGGAYRHVYPMPDGSLVVAYAQGPLDLHDPDISPNFNIIRLVPEPSFHSQNGFKAGSFRREVISSGPDAELWPRPVVARLKEPVKMKLKLQTSLYGEPENIQGFFGYPSGTPSVLQIFDLILLDSFFEQATPVGVRHLAAPVCNSCNELTPEIEQVHFARIIGIKPQQKGERIEQRYIIAEAPIEADGSFYLQIPSEVSFDIQSLNAMRMSLRSPNRWLYSHPGEKHTLSIPRILYAQTCSGCHGGITGKPQDTLRKPDAITSASRTKAIFRNISTKHLFNQNAFITGYVTFATGHNDSILRANRAHYKLHSTFHFMTVFFYNTMITCLVRFSFTTVNNDKINRLFADEFHIGREHTSTHPQ